MKNKIIITMPDGERFKYTGEEYRVGVAPEDAKMAIISDDNGTIAFHYLWSSITIERDV